MGWPKRIAEISIKRSACQNLISGKPKISGKVRFHRVINSKGKKKNQTASANNSQCIGLIPLCDETCIFVLSSTL